MIWLYATEVALVVAAVPTAVWLKREGDRNWARHCAKQRLLAMFGRLNDAVERLGEEIQKFGPPASRLSDRLDSVVFALRGLSDMRKDRADD